jgi:hypothetical protein
MRETCRLEIKMEESSVFKAIGFNEIDREVNFERRTF